MAIQETLAYLFDNKPHSLSSPLTRWMSESPQFTAFVETYRDKIRKKIRSIPRSEGAQDLQAELETAYLLLQERRFSLAYEPYSKGGTRPGPDFAVTFRTRITFNVEVRRMRISSREDGKGQQPGEPPLDHQYESGRLAEIVCNKLGQMLPSMMNLLVIVADHGAICELEVDKAMIRLKQRAEQNDPQLFKRHDFRDRADFFKHYQRLSGVLLRSTDNHKAEKCPVLWINNQTKHPLPAPICTILQTGS